MTKDAQIFTLQKAVERLEKQVASERLRFTEASNQLSTALREQTSSFVEVRCLKRNLEKATKERQSLIDALLFLVDACEKSPEVVKHTKRALKNAKEVLANDGGVWPIKIV